MAATYSFAAATIRAALAFAFSTPLRLIFFFDQTLKFLRHIRLHDHEKGGGDLYFFFSPVWDKRKVGAAFSVFLSGQTLPTYGNWAQQAGWQ